MTAWALVFALPVCVIGAWYALHAGGARAFVAADGPRANRVRIRLRRLNGLAMAACGFVLYFVISRVQQLEPDTAVDPLLPFAVMALVPLLVAIVTLVWLDVRLTRRAGRLAGAGGAAVVVVMLVGGVFGCDPVGQDEASPPPASEARVVLVDLPVPGLDPQPQDLPTVRVELGDTPFDLMLADDAEKRRIGLMFRRQMGRDEGMLFVFPEAEPRAFWMRNTYLPLDIVFLDADGIVLNARQGRPLQESRDLLSEGPAKFVIEVHRGRSTEVGLVPGTRVDLSHVPPPVDAE